MFTKLENYLDKWVSIERKVAMIDALTVLSNMGFMAAWAEISAYLESATDDSLSTVIDTIEGITTVGLDYVLSTHTIIMDGTYVLKTAVVKGLLTIPSYEDTDTVIQLTMECMDPQEALCDLLELTTDYKAQDYCDFIMDVSPSLIQKINQNAVQNSESADVDPEDDLDPVRKKLLISFLTIYKNSIAQTELLDNLFPPGVMDIGFVVDAHKRALLVLEPEGHEQAGVEMIGLALISNAPPDTILKSAKEHLDLVFTDIQFISKVDMSLTNVYNKVFSHG